MALTLQLDVVRAGSLSWNRSPVAVPAEFASVVSALTAGSVVEAKCEWVAGGLAVVALPRVIATGDSFEKSLELALERGNWASVLELMATQPPTELTAAWRTRALLNLDREAEFEKAFAELIALERVDLSNSPTGLWNIRLDIKTEHWLRLPRALRAGAFRLAWRGLLSAKQFREQRFADTLTPQLARLLEEVEPAARPAVVQASGPRLVNSPDPDGIVAWCAAHLAPFATPTERTELRPLFELLANYDPEAKDALRAFRSRPGSEPTVSNALSESIMALTNVKPRPALGRAIDRVGLILARSPHGLVKEFLSGLDQYALVHEARELVPESAESLRARITSVCYRGSVELRIGELEAIVGRAGERWFALCEHDRDWVCTEGTRDDALAAIPDVLFQEAVGLVLGA